MTVNLIVMRMYTLHLLTTVILLNSIVSAKSQHSLSKEFNAISKSSDIKSNTHDTNPIANKICDKSDHFWDKSSIPINERNLIGRAIYQTPQKILDVLPLISSGKTYKLGHIYTSKSPQFLDRVFNTIRQPVGYLNSTLTMSAYDTPTDTIIGYEEQSLYATAIGNSLTQFDGLGHIFITDPFNTGDIQNPSNHYYFNGITGSDLIVNENRKGLQYIGIEKLPSFFTKCILVDVPAYLNIDKIEHDITYNEFIETLQYQGLSVEDISYGDVIIINTGWITSIMIQTGKDYDEIDQTLWIGAFGIEFEVALKIFIPRGVMILGSDTGIDPLSGGLTYHYYWIVCQGGFIHELLNLKQWVIDTRTGEIPYIGVYAFNPLPIKGCPGGIGHPTVFF